MSTQRRSRSAVASAVHRERPHLSSTVLFWTVMLPPTVFLLLSRSPHVLPLMSVLALACAAIVAFAAWCTSDHWDWLVGRSHGRRGELYRSPAAQPSLGRICGTAHDLICRPRDDLSWNG